MKTSIARGHVSRAVRNFALLFLFTSTTAWGQDAVRSFDELSGRLQIGDTVQVFDSGGKKFEGRVAGISSSAMTLDVKKDRVQLWEDSVREIRKRRHDSWWNGALIGGGIGAAAGLAVARGSCGSSDPECAAIARAAFLLPGIGIGAAAGALIDYSMRKYDTLFTASDSSFRGGILLSPFVSRDKKGLQLSFSF